MIIDLTPPRDRTGPARLLDMIDGRSKEVFQTWLNAQTPAFRAGIEVVAMDGLTGFKTAAAESIPDAVAVMDPFHVVAWPATRSTAADNASSSRAPVTAAVPATRYGIRRALRTSAELLTERQQRLAAALNDDAHIEAEPPGATTSASSPPTTTQTAPPPMLQPVNLQLVQVPAAVLGAAPPHQGAGDPDDRPWVTYRARAGTRPSRLTASLGIFPRLAGTLESCPALVSVSGFA